MNFVPGVTAAAAYERGELTHKGVDPVELEGDVLETTPEAYNRVLKEMEKEAVEDIEKDEKRLKKEAKKIAQLEEKLDRKEQEYLDKREDMYAEEELGIEVEKEKLRKAEKKLVKLQGGHDESPCKEKIEEVLDEVKDRAKKVCSNVADFAHMMFADERELKLRERAQERGEVIDGDEYVYDKFESKSEKKLQEAAERVEELRRKVYERQNEVLEQDEEELKKDAEKIKELKKELLLEEAKYAKIADELAEELRYEARIHEEERKLRELQIGTLA